MPLFIVLSQAVQARSMVLEENRQMGMEIETVVFDSPCDHMGLLCKVQRKS